MICNWTKEDFIAQRKKLEELFENEQDVKRKLYLQKVMDYTDKLYHASFNNFPSPLMSNEQRMTDIMDSTLSFSRYYSIVRGFFDKCCDFNESIVDISFKLNRISKRGNFPFLQTGARISQNKVLSMVDNFYRNFDDELYGYFSRVYQERENTVRFLDGKNQEDEQCNGYTIFIDGVLKNFITIIETNPIETYACAVHEYGHAIHNLMNPQNSYTDGDDFFAEVAAIFPEMVAIYENDKEFTPLQTSYYLYSLFITYYDYAELISLHTPVANLWHECKFKFDFKFYHELKKYYDINKKCFNELISTIIDDDGVYVISYIVSLELFHIYKRDKKRAMELFKKILRYPVTEDLLVLFTQELQLNRHSKKEVEIVLNDFNQKIKKRRF